MLLLLIVGGTVLVNRATASQAPASGPWAEAGPADVLPDIYLVIADGHARADVLQQDYAL